MNHTERILGFFTAVSALEKQMTRLRSLYMEAEGLKGADLPPLLVLYSHPEGLRPEDFIHLTRTDKAQISRSLKNLLEKGLVEKESGSHYRARYTLTPQGARIMERMAQESTEIFEKAHLLHGDEEWEGFYAFCSSISDELEHMIASHKKGAKQEGD